MAADEDVVVLVDLFVVVDVGGFHFGVIKDSGAEIVALDEDVVILVDCVVSVYVAEGVFVGIRIGIDGGHGALMRASGAYSVHVGDVRAVVGNVFVTVGALVPVVVVVGFPFRGVDRVGDA